MKPTAILLIGILTLSSANALSAQSCTRALIDASAFAEGFEPPEHTTVHVLGRLTSRPGGVSRWIASGSPESLCRIAIRATLPGVAAEYRAILSYMSDGHDRARNDPGVLFGLAAVLNQLGRSGEVVRQERFRESSDALVRFEYGRALILTGDVDAGIVAMREAMVIDPAAAILLAHYSDEVQSDTDRRKVFQLPIDQLADHYLDEWNRRAAMSGLTLEERLGIHFTRLAHADTMYWGTSGPGDTTTALGPVARRDPRRSVYVRFGEPWRVVYTPFVARGRGESSTFETWAYTDPSNREPMMFHFDGANGRYVLATIPGCFLDWLSDRAAISPRLGLLYHGCMSPRDREVGYRIAQARRELAKAYEYYEGRDFVVPVDIKARFTFALYNFRGRSENDRQVIAVSIVPPSEKPDSILLSTGLFLVDDRTGRIRSAVAKEDEFDRDHPTVFIMHIDSVSPGLHTYRIRSASPDFRLGMTYGGEFTVPDDRRSMLSVSDILLARTDAIGPLRREEHELQPILGAIDAASFRVYMEVYGPPAAVITMEIEVSSNGGLFRRGRRVRIEMTDVLSDDGVTAIARDIEHGLPPGKYKLRVRVRHAASGESAEREIDIEIGKTQQQ